MDAPAGGGQNSRPLVVAVVAAVLILTISAGPLLVAIPLGVMVSLFGGGVSSTDGGHLDANGCANQPAIKSLSADQVTAARIIHTSVVAVGTDHGWAAADIRQAGVVALMTVQQESSLGAGDRWRDPDANGDAGWFQQRTKPGWYGTLSEVNDPVRATQLFLLGRKLTQADVAAARQARSTPAGPPGYTIPGLAQIPNWQTKAPADAAQAVQRSADGSLYTRHEQLARTLTAAFDPAASCTSQTAADLQGCKATGLPAETGLTPDALRVLRCASAAFPDVGWLGVGDRPAGRDDDHQTGRAVDAMISDYTTAAGQQSGTDLAEWIVANRAQLGVKYVIWNSRIWSTTYPNQGWVPCGGFGTSRSTGKASCYTGPNDTQAHRDHVHVSVFGNQATTPPAGAQTNPGPVVAPVDTYVITARFGQSGTRWKARHTGIDLAAGLGTPTKAVAAGTVIEAGQGPSSRWAGNYVRIRHPDGTESLYAHHHSVTVTVGQQVRAGQQIGRMGATGNVTGVHLHLEIHPGGGAAVNPYTWLEQHGVRL